jgi:hypothetical protein
MSSTEIFGRLSKQVDGNVLTPKITIQQSRNDKNRKCAALFGASI